MDFQHFFQPFAKPVTTLKQSPGHCFDRVSKPYSHPWSEQRAYRVYIPSDITEKPLPLVMVLHGCHQTHIDIEATSGFNRVAEQGGFAVVYPFITQYSGMRGHNCWGWWRPEQIKPGSGEVEDLWKIIEEVIADFNIDRHRIHIAGLSSGAAMAVAALVAHPGRFASGAAIAGVAYGESANAVELPFPNQRRYKPLARTLAQMHSVRKSNEIQTPLCIVHSHHDKTVAIEAGKNLRDSWLTFFGFNNQQVQNVNYRHTKGTPWTHTRYGKPLKRAIVETIFLEGPGHGWYGGNPGRYSFPEGPNISSLLWKFFRSHSIEQTHSTKVYTPLVKPKVGPVTITGKQQFAKQKLMTFLKTIKAQKKWIQKNALFSRVKNLFAQK